MPLKDGWRLEHEREKVRDLGVIELRVFRVQELGASEFKPNTETSRLAEVAEKSLVGRAEAAETAPLRGPVHDAVQQRGRMTATLSSCSRTSSEVTAAGMTGPSQWKDAECVHPSMKGVKMPDTSAATPGQTNVPNAFLMYNEYITVRASSGTSSA
ncbi:hypothetical protein PG994_013494 [Apiospora phragmitis]|uniref:DUF7918 domain-containing protein n=1 Tax=Apiospora phragmitis TaxID=2905665 RepID=A0ABR1TAI5_9PEZI